MARRTTTPTESGEPREIRDIEIQDIAEERYIAWAVAANERQVPDIRDGLKPVHRRILVTFRDLHTDANGKKYKGAKLAGDTTGNYHPHGGGAVYEAATKMAQDFSMRYPLIDFQGNFGSIDGDPPAADRYTEMRPSEIGDALLRDLATHEARIVPWAGNYTNDRYEPLVLPGRFPQLLANGQLGAIGAGYSATWLPHNLREVIDAICAVIDDPKLEPSKLGKYLKGPDFPTGGVLLGVDGYRDVLETGKGRVTVRGKLAIETEGRETALVITAIPWQVDKTTLRKQIADLAGANKEGKVEVPGIADVRDESGDWRSDMRLVVALKRDANPQAVAAALYRKTNLEKSYTFNQMAYVDTGSPVLLSTKQAIEHYVSFQLDVLTRRTKHLKAKALDALEVQEAYAMADKYEAKLVPLARKSAGKADLAAKLPTLLPKATKRQCEVIADFRLHQFSKINTDEVTKKIAALRAEIAEYDRLLGSKKAMAELLKTELRELRAKYGDERRTEIGVADDTTVKSLEELLPDEPCVIGVAASGLVARYPASAFRATKRNTAGAKTTRTAFASKAATSDEDPIVQLAPASTRDRLWLLTSDGNLFGCRASDLDETSRGGRGTNPARFLSLASDERIVRVIVPPAELGDDAWLVIASAGGKVQRNKLTDYANLNAAGLKAIKLVGDDAIVSAAIAVKGQHLIAVSSDGFAARFDLEQVSVQGRGSQGVASMNLGPGATVVSLTPIEAADKRDLALVLSNGRGKRSKLGDYPLKGRAVRGVVTVDLGKAAKGADAVRVAFAAPIADDDEVFFTTSAGKVVRLDGKEIKRQGRATAGVMTVALSASKKDPETVTGGAVRPA